MSQLIAMVATAVMVNGQRTVIQPGEALPDLNSHDEKELLANGLAMDPEKQAANDKARKQEEAAAMNAFKQARKNVQAAQESTQADQPADGTDNKAAPEAKSTGKK